MESAIPEHLVTERTIAPRMREGHTPPYPSFSARFGDKIDGVTCALLGVQSPAPLNASAQQAAEQIWEACAAEDGPVSREVATHVDEQGYENRLILAYWDDQERFERWFARHRDAVIGAGESVEDHGRWIEVIAPAASDMETLYSADTFQAGVTYAAAGGFSDEIAEHGYWGSMRDRMPRGQTDRLDPSGAPEVGQGGGIIRVQPHHNLTMIRSGQDWGECGEKERDSYSGDVEPHLKAGMDFLMTEGPNIGCYTNRYMTSCEIDGTKLPHSFGLSFWHSLANLERWAESHPTHLKIFGAAMRFLQDNANTRLRLTHEVFVLTRERQRYEYNNCHATTGMLGAARMPEVFAERLNHHV